MSLLLQLDEPSLSIHHAIMQRFPHLIITEQPGFRSINYGKKPGMNHVVFYVIMYKNFTNLGFPRGVDLIPTFPFLKGTGKTHRHVTVTQDLRKQPWFFPLLDAAEAL